jgi:hypothetical protein
LRRLATEKHFQPSVPPGPTHHHDLRCSGHDLFQAVV